MFILDGQVVWTATDLSRASECEYSLLRTLDVALGRLPKEEERPDPLMDRVAELGNQHEATELDRLRGVYGRYDEAAAAGVCEIERPRPFSREMLLAKREETLDALGNGADVVFQAAFFDGGFQGFADFLVRDRGYPVPTYTVCDTKLARSEKPKALLQLAAYADQLVAAGVSLGNDAELLLGSGRRARFPVADIAPVFRERRGRLLAILQEHVSADRPVVWGDDRYLACGICAACSEAAERSRDLLLVAGVRMTQRKKLLEAGIDTIEALAVHPAPIDGMPRRTFHTLQAQAALQVRQVAPADGPPEVLWDVFNPEQLRSIPSPSEGDIFFDFEGDPMWTDGDAADWGLEYLFGVVEAPLPDEKDGRFVPFWAHDRAAEKRALEDFMAYVAKRRETYPDMHIYHYAAYEKSALTRLSLRHGVCEEEVDDLLRHGVLVDLYAVVRGALRVSQPSYSIKKLEPLYMGAALRAGEVQDAAASIVEYHAYCEARDSGDTDQAGELLTAIADYNEYDCVSTLGLRDWLLDRAAELAITPKREADVDESRAAAEPDPLEGRLAAFAGDGPRTDDEQAVAMIAAALGYSRRENKPHWWAHFDRLRVPVDEWAHTRDVLVVESAEVVGDWQRPTPNSNPHRKTRLVGHFGVGSTIEAGDTVRALYDAPVPDCVQVPVNGTRGCTRSGVLVDWVGYDGTDHDVVVIDETLPRGAEEYSGLPVAIAPGDPVPSKKIDEAIREVATAVHSDLRSLPSQPAVDVLRRVPPRLRGGGSLPQTGDHLADILDAVRRLDHSYVAVQGPPGTGKTHVGSHVIARLVLEHGWRVGVVAQSHAVVENMLGAVVQAGVPGAQVAKKGGDPRRDTAWTVIPDNGHPAHLATYRETGCVLGGTAWDFANENRFERDSLDLLVIDEAGQFSLAHTVGVSVAAPRLLLLGDPQQLPQVSQGMHPEPVNGSALGWLIAGHPTLPPERGYFLETTWRMHPLLCAKDSRLSYADRLLSNEKVTRSRSLAGVEPGLLVRLVEHKGNSVESDEEAAEVVAQVRRLVGTAWTDPQAFDGSRPLAQSDFRVVAPYNAQVIKIRNALAVAGYPDVPVGTVDKFQGQQAAVVIVSMTASAVDDIPRGMAFLLNRNRVNVAISRGQWLTVLVRSPALTSYLPRTPEALLELGAFIGLCEPDA